MFSPGGQVCQDSYLETCREGSSEPSASADADAPLVQGGRVRYPCKLRGGGTDEERVSCYPEYEAATNTLNLSWRTHWHMCVGGSLTSDLVNSPCTPQMA